MLHKDLKVFSKNTVTREKFALCEIAVWQNVLKTIIRKKITRAKVIINEMNK